MKSLCQTRISPGRTALGLATVAAGLIVAHVVAMQLFFNDGLELTNTWRLEYWHVAMLDLDEEEAFGTWFSAVLLLYTGRLLLLEAAAAKAARDGTRLWWFVLACGFHFLSIDEVAGMHEYLNSMLGEHADGAKWTDVAIVGLGAVVLGFLPFLFRVPRRTAALFVVAGLVYAGGAVGVERWTGSDVDSLSYNMWTAFEEGLEMAGVILMIYAVLDHLRGGAPHALQVDVSRTDA